MLTIGHGHTGADVMENSCISPEYAEYLLRKDLFKAESSINELVKVSLTQNQFDALVSFTFNVGVHNIERSTLLSKLNSGDYQGAGEELLKWHHAGGKDIPGLVSRRSAERGLFFS